MRRFLPRRSFLTTFLLLLMNLTVLIQPAGAGDFPVVKRGDNFIVREVATGLGIPWGMAWVDEDRMLVTERGGALKVLNRKNGAVKPVFGVPQVFASGQGGLLDIAGPPAGAKDWFYFTYSKAVEGQGVTTLARAKYKDGRMADWQDLLVTQSRTDTGRHFGSRIAFDGKGYVYFGIGDRGDRPNSQNLKNHAGTIMRLKLDGSVPEDNPFVGRKDALPEIWSYGHRNPQGMAYDYENDRLWSIEHGPRGGDEINLIERGANYGWPEISYGKEYWGPFDVGDERKAGMKQPIKYYDPSIAPGSLVLYRGAAFPQWQGNLFAGALVLTHLNRIELSSDLEVVREERLLEDMGERIRALLVSPEGWLYLSTDTGRILQLSPAE